MGREFYVGGDGILRRVYFGKGMKGRPTSECGCLFTRRHAESRLGKFKITREEMLTKEELEKL